MYQHMYRRIVLISALVLVILFSVAHAFQGKGNEILTINKEGKFGSITFPHFKHQEVLKDCNACHAQFPQKTGIVSSLKAKGTLKKKQVMKTCRGCHKDMLKQKAKTGPVKCNGCHKR